MLQLLKAVPGSEGQAQVAAAFQSVQLLASDYMSTLPPGLLPPCLNIVSLYAQQQVCWCLLGLPCLPAPRWQWCTSWVLAWGSAWRRLCCPGMAPASCCQGCADSEMDGQSHAVDWSALRS